LAPVVSKISQANKIKGENNGYFWWENVWMNFFTQLLDRKESEDDNMIDKGFIQK
jgi:hypothetical protein